MIPSDESGVIEQAKFTYSTLGKAFEKQIKKTEDEGQKQINAIEVHGKKIVKSNDIIKKYDYETEKDSLKILRQKEIFNKMINERYDEAKKINSNDLIYHFKKKKWVKTFQ